MIVVRGNNGFSPSVWASSSLFDLESLLESLISKNILYSVTQTAEPAVVEAAAAAAAAATTTTTTTCWHCCS